MNGEAVGPSSLLPADKECVESTKGLGGSFESTLDIVGIVAPFEGRPAHVELRFPLQLLAPTAN